LIGPAIEQGEDCAARASEQKVPETVECTHSENNSAQDENEFQGFRLAIQTEAQRAPTAMQRDPAQKVLEQLHHQK
jgi:hypothetical protein